MPTTRIGREGRPNGFNPQMHLPLFFSLFRISSIFLSPYRFLFLFYFEARLCGRDCVLPRRVITGIGTASGKNCSGRPGDSQRFATPFLSDCSKLRMNQTEGEISETFSPYPGGESIQPPVPSLILEAEWKYV